MNYLWLVVVFLLLLVEFMSATVVTIWFAIGALVAFILSFITQNYLIETIVFVLTGIILLIILRPTFNIKIKKFITKFKRVK